MLLADRVGEEFDAAVLDVDERRDQGQRPRTPAGGVVALDDPPVRARCAATLPLGERVRVRLVQGRTPATPDRASSRTGVTP